MDSALGGLWPLRNISHAVLYEERRREVHRDGHGQGGCGTKYEHPSRGRRAIHGGLGSEDSLCERGKNRDDGSPQ
jgi:hypothetical protein